MSNKESFQLEDEDLNGTCPFVMVHGPELADGRLTDGEKILLFWLRLRSRSTKGKNTWVSWEAIAQDLGISESAVKRRAKKLRDLGWIKCESRGYSRSKKKLLARASSMYDDGLWSWDFWNWCVHGRTQEQIDELRSIQVKNDPNEDSSNLDGDLDSAKEDPLRSDLTHHSGRLRPIISVKNDPSEEEKKNKEKSEVDSLKVGNQPLAESQDPPMGIGFSKGEAYDLSTGEVIKKVEEPKALVSDLRKTKGETAATPESGSFDDADGATRRAEANALIARKGAEADRKSREVLGKRRAKKAAQEASGEAEMLRRVRREEKAATKKQRQTVKGLIEEHIRDTYRNWFPDAKLGRFAGKEYGQLNSLIEIYEGDAEFIKKAWTFLCEEWDELRIKLKIDSPVPTIGIFLGFRERIFSQVQEQATKRQEQEKKGLGKQFDW